MEYLKPSVIHSSHVKYLAELVGTFFLVFTVGCNVHTASIGAAISIGAILTVMVYSLGSVSGAHLNPAVTLSILLSGRGKIGCKDSCCYIVAQSCGALVGALTYSAIFNDAFVLKPQFNYTAGDAFLVEMLYTMALCYVVLNVATTENLLQGNVPNDFFGLAIGLTVTAAAITIGPISGCCLNPAVALGTFTAAALADHTISVGMLMVYCIAGFTGAVLGALFFYFVQGGLTHQYEYVGKGGLRFTQRLAQLSGSSYLRKGSIFPIPPELETHTLQVGVKWQVPGWSARDIDVSCTKFTNEAKLLEAVYFAYPEGNLESKKTKPVVVHQGDNVTGASRSKKKADTDDERIEIRKLSDLSRLEPRAQYLCFTVNVFSTKEFIALEHLRIRVMDKDTGDVICCFDKPKMTANKDNAFILGCLYHQQGRWYFEVVDEAHSIGDHGTYRQSKEWLEWIVKSIAQGSR